MNGEGRGEAGQNPLKQHQGEAVEVGRQLRGRLSSAAWQWEIRQRSLRMWRRMKRRRRRGLYRGPQKDDQ